MSRSLFIPARAAIERKTVVVDRRTMAHHAARFAVKADSVAAEKRTFTGLASTWDLDQGGDQIQQGAYARTLREWKDAGRTIPLINQHQYWDAKNAIGKMLEARETDVGLETTFQLVGSAEGDEFLARIRDGILDGLSIGYEVRGWRAPTDEEKQRGVFRVLTDIELREVSLVIWGMNENALIDTSSVKSIASALAALRRETLTDDDRKTVRQIAALSGALLRPKEGQPPASDPLAADAGTDGSEQTPSPDAPPGDPAAAQEAPKTYAKTDELQQRLRSIRLATTLTDLRLTSSRGILA